MKEVSCNGIMLRASLRIMVVFGSQVLWELIKGFHSRQQAEEIFIRRYKTFLFYNIKIRLLFENLCKEPPYIMDTRVSDSGVTQNQDAPRELIDRRPPHTFLAIH